MQDAVYVLVTLGFFGLTWLLVMFCDRLRPEKSATEKP
jgi:hypothetical protein